MSCFTLAPVLRSEWTRLAEIRHDSFKGANDPITTAAHMFNGVTKEDYVAWNINVLENLTPKPGYRIDIIAARDEDRTIAGWAEWSIPVDPTSRHEPKSDEVKVLEKSIVEVPKGARADIWNEFVAASYAYEQKYMGDRRHWSTSIRCTPGFSHLADLTSCYVALILLVIDPAYQRRGVGRLLTQDGIVRAHADGFPLFVSASPPGAKLYQSLGFELKATPQITQANVTHRMLVKELPASS
jgi:GNAT superfamily N-acetyltransferase